MMDVGQTPTGSQNDGWIKMYYYLSPPSGSQTVAVTGGTTASVETGYVWAAYSGFAQSGQPDSTGKLDNTVTAAAALSTTVVGSQCWSVAGFTSQGGTPTSYTNGTGRIFATPNGGLGIVDSNGIAPAGSYAMTVNQGNQETNGIAASFGIAQATANPAFLLNFI
jgi:hypothetical protein